MTVIEQARPLPADSAVEILDTVASRTARLTRSAERSLSYKQDDEDASEQPGHWFVNKHGVLFAVVGETYFAVDTSKIPALQDLPEGEYTHAQIAAQIAEAEADE